MELLLRLLLLLLPVVAARALAAPGLVSSAEADPSVSIPEAVVAADYARGTGAAGAGGLALAERIRRAERRREAAAVWQFRDLQPYALALEAALPSIRAAAAAAMAANPCECEDAALCGPLTTRRPRREVLGYGSSVRCTVLRVWRGGGRQRAKQGARQGAKEWAVRDRKGRASEWRHVAVRGSRLAACLPRLT